MAELRRLTGETLTPRAAIDIPGAKKASSFHELQTFSKKGHKNFTAVVQDATVGRVTDPWMCRSAGFSERFSQLSLFFVLRDCVLFCFSFYMVVLFIPSCLCVYIFYLA